MDKTTSATPASFIAAVRVNRESHRLAAAGLGPGRAKTITQRILTVFTYEGVSIAVRRGRGRSLLLQQYCIACVLEGCRRATRRSANASTFGIICKAGCRTPLRGARQLAIVIIRQGVGRSGEGSAGLLSVGIVAIAVVQSTG